MRHACILALLASIGVGARGSVPQVSQPSFRSASELVVVPVTVLDRKGAFVSGIPRERFIVHDNGQRQELMLFSNEDAPVTTALLIDDSGSMRGRLGEVIAAVHAFARSSNQDDELFAFEFNDRVRDALGGRRILASDGAELEAALRTLVPTGQTALYDAITSALERLEHAAHSRKVLVVLSDGGDNASRASNLEGVLRRARDSNVTIYTIGLFDPGSPDTNPGVLKRLSETTGGERFLPTSPAGLLAACRRIARAIRSGYMLGYQPPAHDGAFHRIQIRIDGPEGRKLDVRTRSGYFAARQ